MNTWNMFEQLTDTIGAEEMATAMAQAMSTQELKETCEYIARMYDVSLEDEDEE